MTYLQPLKKLPLLGLLLTCLISLSTGLNPTDAMAGNTTGKPSIKLSEEQQKTKISEATLKEQIWYLICQLENGKKAVYNFEPAFNQADCPFESVKGIHKAHFEGRKRTGQYEISAELVTFHNVKTPGKVSRHVKKLQKEGKIQETKNPLQDFLNEPKNIVGVYE